MNASAQRSPFSSPPAPASTYSTPPFGPRQVAALRNCVISKMGTPEKPVTSRSQPWIVEHMIRHGKLMLQHVEEIDWHPGGDSSQWQAPQLCPSSCAVRATRCHALIE